ncbi:hypothetical protein TNCV_724781 [Trichonephila clavipes]|nr:hypothetical protein TNCV_724781 [Trichonephila clavipes]
MKIPIHLRQRGILAAVAEWSRYRIVAGLVTSSSPVPLKTRRVGERCTLNLSRAQTSSRCKAHSQQPLVYVALSRVTAQEGLHIVPTDGRQLFYYGRRNNEAMLPLRNEYTRLSTVHLTAIDQIMINKMNGGEMILFSLNCQCLGAHVRDLRGVVGSVSKAVENDGGSKPLVLYSIIPVSVYPLGAPRDPAPGRTSKNRSPHYFAAYGSAHQNFSSERVGDFGYTQYNCSTNLRLLLLGLTNQRQAKFLSTCQSRKPHLRIVFPYPRRNKLKDYWSTCFPFMINWVDTWVQLFS